MATKKDTEWLNDFTGSANGVTVYTQDQNAIKDKMNQNSIQWHGADKGTQDALHAENQYLASLLGDGVKFDGGYWGGNANGTPAQVASGMVEPKFEYNVSKPTYTNNHSTRIDALLNQVLNREAFSYNAEADPTYQQYKTQYNREGDRSMRDTLASVASGAGGMNSYAVTAAQQANDYYAAKLADKIPELKQLAYQMYLDDYNRDVTNLGLLRDVENTEYSRYKDSLDEWYTDRDFSYDQHRDDVGDYQWGATFNYQAGRDANADRYQDGRDQISDSRYDNETAYNRAMELLTAGVMPDSSLLASAGISTSVANALLAKVAANSTPAGSGDGDDPDAGSIDYLQMLIDAGVDMEAFNALYGDQGNGGGDGTEKLKSLGVDNMDAITVVELANMGAIYEDESGNLHWNAGWNAENYLTKLANARGFKSGGGGTGFTYVRY